MNRFEPFVETALVQQPRLAVEELLDLADQVGSDRLVTHGASPAPSPFANSRQLAAVHQLRPAAGRIRRWLLSLKPESLDQAAERRIEALVAEAHLVVDRHAGAT